MSKRTLLGMITPSSNTVLEPVTSLMLADLLPDVSAHFSRFRVTEISLQKAALAQFDTDAILKAAHLLTDIRPASIAWNGTSASWLGFDKDRTLCAAIEKETGVPAITSVLALNEILEREGIRRIALVTPYQDDVQARIVANYQSLGITCVGDIHFQERDNFAFAEFTENYLEHRIREAARSAPQAIVILCTNLRGARLVPGLERETGIPIYDSVAVVVWKALRQAGIDPRALARWGSVFELI